MLCLTFADVVPKTHNSAQVDRLHHSNSCLWKELQEVFVARPDCGVVPLDAGGDQRIQQVCADGLHLCRLLCVASREWDDRRLSRAEERIVVLGRHPRGQVAPKNLEVRYR
jgi:hypothetical protein